MLFHRQQPRGSRICGQTCVAIVSGRAIPAAMQACTKGRQRTTSEHDLRAGLKTFGLELGAFQKNEGYPPLVGLALARMRTKGFRNRYHWIVLAGSTVHDPSFEKPYDAPEYMRYMRSGGHYVTSWAPVTKP